MIQQYYCEEKSDAGQSWGLKDTMLFIWLVNGARQRTRKEIQHVKIYQEDCWTVKWQWDQTLEPKVDVMFFQ